MKTAEQRASITFCNTRQQTIDMAIKDANRYRFLQNIPALYAQAYFWEYSSRKQRSKAIDRDMARKESRVTDVLEADL